MAVVAGSLVHSKGAPSCGSHCILGQLMVLLQLGPPL